MKLNTKEYLRIKTKEYLQKNKLFFFLNSINTNSSDWLKAGQSLNTMGFSFLKSEITKKFLKDSIFKNLKEIANGTTFLIKPKKQTQLSRDILLYRLCPLLFTLLAIKVNNKIYTLTALKKNQNTINYKNNILLLYQFSMTNLKYHTKLIFNIIVSK